MFTISIVLFIIFMALSIGVSIRRQLAKNEKTQWRQTKDFEETFKNSQIKSPPSLKLDSSYGWASFSITFSSKEDMEFAESSGLIGQFKERIKTYYDKEFDPDRAIFCTYIGYVPRWKTILNNEGTENKQ